VRRFAYNWALNRWKEKHQAGEKSDCSGYSLVKEFNAIRREQFPWTYDVTKWASQKAIQDLGATFKRFFNKQNRYPQFKKKGRCRDSFYLGLVDFKLEGKKIHIPKLGWIKMAQELRFPGKPKSVTISREGSEWFVSVLVDVDPSWKYPHQCKSQATVGIDLGIGDRLAILSDGTIIENPRVYRRLERKIKRFNQSLSRKQKGSKNREKIKTQLARLHTRIRRVRADTTHRMTAQIVEQYRVIGVEDLSVKGMMKNRRLSKSFGDASLGEILRQLQYKSELAGCELVQADRGFPSSKLCSECGWKNADLQLGDREWVCEDCGCVHDRDLNAARNLEIVAQRHRETINACGEDVRLRDLRIDELFFNETGTSENWMSIDCDSMRL